MNFLAIRYVDVVCAPDCFMYKLNDILPILIEAVANDAEEIWLFGSMARGSSTGMSDIDLMVVVDTTDREYLKEVSRKVGLTDLREDVGYIPVDIIVRTKTYLESSEFFAQQVRQDKKILWRR